MPQKGVASDQRQMNDHEIGSRKTGKTFFESFFGYAKKFLLIVVLILLVLFIVTDSFFVTKAGYIAIYENPRAEELEVYMTPGLHTKVPFFPVTRYKQVWVVDFGTGYAGLQLRERKPPIELTFADTYKAKVPATFRYQLPTSEDRIKAIHQDFTTFELLIDALLIPISRDAMVSAAALSAGEDFFQGGVSQFKAVLEDQIQNGTYKTKLIEVEVKRGNVAVSDPQLTQQSTSLKWKTEPVRDEKGQIERLQTKSISDYGIELKQVTLGVPVPESELAQLLADKKRVMRLTIQKADELALILEDQKIQLVNIEKEKQTRLATILKEESIQFAKIKRNVKIQLADIENAEIIERAKKAEELALVEDEKKIQLANTEKAEKVQLANIERDKKVKRAQQAVQLTLIQDSQKVQAAEKAKELFIAEAELKIQEVHLKKSQIEAKAILEKGNAKADILKAEYLARIPEIYHAEIKKEIAEIIYSNLKGINVTMPHNVVNLGESGGNSLQTNLDVLSSFATIKVMEGMEKKALENNPIK